MIYLGLGLVEAHHPYSKGDHTYTSKELLDWLVDTCMPLVRRSTLPTEAPTKAPRLPELAKLGTSSALAFEKEQFSKNEEDKFKAEAHTEFKRLQDIGEIDLFSARQTVLPPKISTLKGFKLEMCFAYPGLGGAQCLDWYRGTIDHVIDEEKFSVMIEWDQSTLAEGDVTKSAHRLLPFHWNPKKIRKNAWRKYISE